VAHSQLQRRSCFQSSPHSPHFDETNVVHLRPFSLAAAAWSTLIALALMTCFGKLGVSL
jgi:hypothetical protein